MNKEELISLLNSSRLDNRMTISSQVLKTTVMMPDGLAEGDDICRITIDIKLDEVMEVHE